jgi:hypothetical protein
MVELHQDNPVAILNIAKGLAAIIRKREQQNTLATLAFNNKISDLKLWLDNYQNTVPLLTSDHPKGYVINDETRVPNFVIPMGDGDHQQAYWVKQLAEGQVAGLPREYVPGQTPFVTEVYASPATGQEDIIRPVHAMPGWLWSLLTGPAAHYGTLLKHVEVTNDWGVVGEVLRFQQLEHHLSDLRLRIAHHEAEFKGVSQAQAMVKGCLELTHIDYYASDLCVLSSLESRGGARANQRHHRQWCGMEPF